MRSISSSQVLEATAGKALSADLRQLEKKLIALRVEGLVTEDGLSQKEAIGIVNRNVDVVTGQGMSAGAAGSLAGRAISWLGQVARSPGSLYGAVRCGAPHSDDIAHRRIDNAFDQCRQPVQGVGLLVAVDAVVNALDAGDGMAKDPFRNIRANPGPAQQRARCSPRIMRSTDDGPSVAASGGGIDTRSTAPPAAPATQWSSLCAPMCTLLLRCFDLICVNILIFLVQLGGFVPLDLRIHNPAL